MNEVYRHDVVLKTDEAVTAVRRTGNRLTATVSNIYSSHERELTVDQIVGEVGTLPNDELYFELKPRSRNLGELDLDAMTRFEPQRIDTHPQGEFFLYRIGDAWASRNIHASVLDAMRVCKDL